MLPFWSEHEYMYCIRVQSMCVRKPMVPEGIFSGENSSRILKISDKEKRHSVFIVISSNKPVPQKIQRPEKRRVNSTVGNVSLLSNLLSNCQWGCAAFLYESYYIRTYCTYFLEWVQGNTSGFNPPPPPSPGAMVIAARWGDACAGWQLVLPQLISHRKSLISENITIPKPEIIV
jgi:hypothetical protein